MPTSRARAARASAAYSNGGGAATQSMSPAAAAAFASLQQQVIGLESDFTTQMGRVETALDALNRKIDSQAANLAASSQTDWKSLAPWAMFLIVLGGALYYPINQTSVRLERDIAMIQAGLVPRVEHEREWRRAETALADAKAKAEKNQDLLITKEVFVQTTSGLQRQIEEIRKDVGGVITTRDVLQDQSKRMERLELEMRSMNSDRPHR